MNTNLIKEIVMYFNYFVFYYVLCINTIYFIQLLLSAFGLYDYIKKCTILIIKNTLTPII